ncbi:LysM peptidoglycan-binding domain-containing protein [Aerococcaceae bacterium NML191219]|nr:LysM peptidoglycan-binding domain-containing protein [Aerococcaceae bacterium NML191219]
MKVLKKSKGKWIAVSLAAAAMVLTNQAVSAQETETPEAHQSSVIETMEQIPDIESETLQEGTVSISENTAIVSLIEETPISGTEANPLATEQQRALENITPEWKVNSVAQIKNEVERQSALGLSDYVIQWGDTLFNISQVANANLSQLLELNQIDNPDLIYTGEVLKGVLYRQQQVEEKVETLNKVQEEQHLSQERMTNTWSANSVAVIQQEINRQSQRGLDAYVIQWGDTLYNLSQAAGTTVDRLIQQNSIVNPDLIYTGALLKGVLPLNPPIILKDPELIFDKPEADKSTEEKSAVPGNYPTVELPIAELPPMEEKPQVNTKPKAEQPEQPRVEHPPLEHPKTEPDSQQVPQTAPTAPEKPTLSIERYVEAYNALKTRLSANDDELLTNKTPNSIASYTATKEMIRNDAIALEDRLSNMVTQAELDEVSALLERRLNQLNEAAQMLLERIDVTTLSRLVEAIPTMPVMEGKTPSSITAYQERRNALQPPLDEALQHARTIVANPNVTSAELVQASERLNEVYTQINQASSLLQNQANKTNAQEAANSLNTLVTALDSLDTNNKTPRTIASFRNALNQANTALTALNQGIANLDIAQTDLDRLSQTVTSAHQALAVAQSQLVDKGDKTTLHQLWLSLREQVSKEGKTPNSIQAYEEAIARLFNEQNEVDDSASRVLKDVNATQEEVDAQVALVQAVKNKENQAKALLVDQADKTVARNTQRELQETLALSERVEVANKTPESVAAFSAAKEEAKRLQVALTTLLADANATQMAVNSAQRAANQAKEALVRAQSQLQEQPKAEQPIELLSKKIEFRNVSNEHLYRLSEGKHMVKLLHLDATPTDVNNLFIKVDLEDDKEVWLNVNNVKLVNNEYVVTGRLPELVQFNSADAVQENYSIRVAKKSTEQGVYTSFKQLIEAIRQNTSGTFIIGSDLTATEIPKDVNSSSYLEDITFTGTLKSKDNHRFTIYDLKKSLFKDLFNATISNIHLANVDVKATQAEAVGALAHTLDNSRVEYVSAEGNVAGRVLAAGLIGVADKGSHISNSSFVGRVSSAQSAAGLVGRITRGSSVDKSFADINIGGSLNSTDRLGGLASEINEGGSLTNSYVKGYISNYGEGDASVGGAVGIIFGPHDRQDTGQISNVISYVKVLNGANFIGNLQYLTKTEKNLSHNYVVDAVVTGNHAEHESLSRLSQAEADRRIATMYTNPIHTHATLTNASRVNYSKVRDYRSDYTKAYRNMEKLLPLYDRHTIVKEGNNLNLADTWNQKEIESVIPYINDQIATHFYKNKNQINKLLVRYTDGTKEFVNLNNPTEFSTTGIVEYTIEGKGVAYHANQLIKDNQALVSEIMTLINSTEFNYELFNPANLAEWEAKDRDIRLEKLYLRDSFAIVKPKMEKILSGLLDNTAVGDYTSGSLHEYMKHYLRDNVKALLVGSTYLERWYSFSNVLDTLLYGMSTYNSKADSLELVTDLGSDSIDTLKSFATQATYAQVFSKYTGISGLTDFVKKNYDLHKDNETTIDDWFKSVSKAYIVTRDSQSKPERKGEIFKRLSIPEFQRMLLPLLTIKEEHVYAIMSSNSISFGIFDTYMDGVTKNYSNYEQKLAEVRRKIDDTADAIQRYFDVLYRILNAQSVQRLLETNLEVFDTYEAGYDWSDEYGPGAFESVKAFAAPIGRWQPLNTGASAYAPVAWNIELVHYAKGRLLSEKGWSTLTHEHMHNLDDRVILGGYGKRFGHGAESYAMGLFQSHGTLTDTIGFNLIYKDDTSGKQFAIHNASPERFNSMTDLEQYMRRAFDVLYTLEAAEAEAMISKGANYIKNNYRVIRGEPGYETHRADVIRSITNELQNKTLSRDLLVDLGIVSKLIPDRYYGLDDYIQVDMFNAQFGIMENSEGASGGLTFRRVAFELLAEKGYYEGMIPYISNQYASDAFKETGKVISDTFILKKIFGEQYKDFKEFRKDMLKRRHEAAQHLKPVQIFYGNRWNYQVNSYQDIVNLMKQEMNKNNRYAIQTLKRDIYRAFFQQTNEFRDSIYKDTLPTNQP